MNGNHQGQNIGHLTQKPGRILPLSPEAISQIHSSKHITTLQGVIISLLENSLDAGANKVDISVDWRRGDCTVQDDGVGISAAEFEETGCLGKMYCTSKREATKQTHGQAGTFLAELGAMSLLSVSSVQISNGESKMTMHHGKVIARQTNAHETGTAFANLHQNYGTTVTVRDLFGNMPVRVKQRSLTSEMGNDEEKSWQELKRGVVALLLSWHTSCTAKLRDTNHETRTLILTSGNSGALTERALSNRSMKSTHHDIRDALPIILQAGLAPMESRQKWVPLSASTSVVTLKGMICLDPSPSRQCQFLAIGITPCTSREFFHAVNKVFESSNFGMVEGSGGGGRDVREEKACKTGLDHHARYFMQVSFLDVQLRDRNMNEATMQSVIRVLEAAVYAWLETHLFRPRKRSRNRRNDKPQSVAQMDTSRSLGTFGRPRLSISSGADATRLGTAKSLEHSSSRMPHLDGTSTRQRIVDLSTDAFANQLAVEDGLAGYVDWHALSHARSGSSRGLPNTTTTAQRDQLECGGARSVPAELGNTMAIPVHQTKKPFAPPMLAGELNSTSTSQNKSSSALSPVARSSSDEFDLLDDNDLLAAVRDSELDQTDVAAPNDNITTWTDPVSKQIFQVNLRTGVVLPIPDKTDRASSSHNGPRHRAAINTAVSSAGRAISLARRSAHASATPESFTSGKDKWLPGFLEEWKNPVFAQRKEEPIPAASISGPGLIEQLEEDRRCCAENKYHQAFVKHGARTGGSSGTKLSRTALQYAEVIGQVDRKFILVKMPSSSGEDDRIGGQGSTLVLIDQHAASERIILEDLLANMVAAPAPAPATSTSTSTSESMIRPSSLLHSTTRAKTLTFEISTREHELFTRHSSHFQHWGIRYVLPPPTFASSLEGRHNNNDRTGVRHRLVATHLPAVIAERCSNFPALAIELLRAEIWAIEDGTRKSSIFPDLALSGEWISLLPLMPTKLLHMIQSRACRSAIMFNDILARSDCEALMRGLASCKFPFVCAHGRCGVVPVFDLNHEGEGIGRQGNGAKILLGRAEIKPESEAGQKREGGVDLRSLRYFISNGKDDGGMADEEEDMVEQSPHKFG